MASRKNKAAQKGFPLVLLLGGAAALFLVLLLGAAGVGAFLYLRSKTEGEEPQLAQVEPKNETDNRDDNKTEKTDDKNGKPDKIEPKKGPNLGDLPPELLRVKQSTVQVLTA